MTDVLLLAVLEMGRSHIPSLTPAPTLIKAAASIAHHSCAEDADAHAEQARPYPYPYP